MSPVPTITDPLTSIPPDPVCNLVFPLCCSAVASVLLSTRVFPFAVIVPPSSRVRLSPPVPSVNILVDGYDYLYSGDVLDILYEKYKNTNCLITYGSHLSSKGIQGKKYPRLIRKLNLYRK